MHFFVDMWYSYSVFNWFKNKHSLIPDDIDEGIVSSNFCDVKLNSKIAVHENIVCFVTYKDKLYLTLTAGEYEFNTATLPEIYRKQAKNEKLKKVLLDLFFVNMNEFVYDFSLNEKVKINRDEAHLKFDIMSKYKVKNPTVIFKYIQNEFEIPTAKASNDCINYLIKDITKKQIYKTKFAEPTLSINQAEAISDKVKNEFLKIGIEVTQFYISLANNPNEIMPKKKIEMPKIEETPAPPIDQPEKKEYTEENTQKTCPNCGMKLIPNAMFCHRCGKVL